MVGLSLSNPLLARAWAFAQVAYRDHPECLQAGEYAACLLQDRKMRPTLIAAAMLHSVTVVSPNNVEDIASIFGSEVGVLVSEIAPVSRRSDGLLRNRLAIDTEHFALASFDGATVKLATAVGLALACGNNNKLGLQEVINSVCHGDPELLDLAKRSIPRVRLPRPEHQFLKAAFS